MSFNHVAVLNKLDIPLNGGPASAVQIIGDIIRTSSSPTDKAISIIETVLGHSVPEQIDDMHLARLTAQHLIDVVFKRHETLNLDETFNVAFVRAKRYRYDPTVKYLFEQQDRNTSYTKATTTKDVGGVNIQVKADGSIKKGGKQPAANALYITHVVQQSMSTKDFLEVLQDKLGMSLAGARTYFYNAKKAYETSK